MSGHAGTNGDGPKPSWGRRRGEEAGRKDSNAGNSGSSVIFLDKYLSWMSLVPSSSCPSSSRPSLVPRPSSGSRPSSCPSSVPRPSSPRPCPCALTWALNAVSARELSCALSCAIPTWAGGWMPPTASPGVRGRRLPDAGVSLRTHSCRGGSRWGVLVSRSPIAGLLADPGEMRIPFTNRARAVQPAPREVQHRITWSYNRGDELARRSLPGIRSSPAS